MTLIIILEFYIPSDSFMLDLHFQISIFYEGVTGFATDCPTGI